LSNNPCSLQQVSNRNFLSLAGFKLIINRCPKVDFLCNKANLPGITLGVAVQTTYLKDIPVPGDKLRYEDLTINFIVDENLENYYQIYQWMTSLGYPQSVAQYSELQTNNRFYPNTDGNDPYSERSDGTLLILNSNYQTAGKVIFKDLFPTFLSGIPFDATLSEQQYYTATCTFRYTIFDLIDIDGKEV
jgi:hypothetical protein